MGIIKAGLSQTSLLDIHTNIKINQTILSIFSLGCEHVMNCRHSTSLRNSELETCLKAIKTDNYGADEVFCRARSYNNIQFF